MIRFAKALLRIAFVALAIFCGFLAYMTVEDYSPEKVEILQDAEKGDVIEAGKELKVLSWNIGYAGLDANMDFFYDGGTQVRPSQWQVEHNLDAISSYLCERNDADFMLVQEIDRNSKRSYGTDQVNEIKKRLNFAVSYFAKNYSVKWVPIPLTEPMGNVESGVAVFSKKQANVASRYSFPVNFDWPLKVFMLDRCFLSLRYPVSNGKELVMICTHNSAFDDGGELRKAELSYFRDFLVKEYEKGNYVIAGGDFNQCPAGFNPEPFKDRFDYEDYHTVPSDLFPNGWQFVFDGNVASNRRVVAPYNKETTKVTVIDFFLASPNVEVSGVKTADLQYAHSDHNPVEAKFVLR